MTWFSFLSPVVEAVATPIKEWQTRKTEVAKAKHTIELAELNLRAKLMSSEQSHNQEWEIQSLKVRKRSPMQWISFLVLGSPFVIAWFDAGLVKDYFEVSLQVIPEWYQQVFISIVGVIWGIHSVKDAYKDYLLRKDFKDSKK